MRLSLLRLAAAAGAAAALAAAPPADAADAVYGGGSNDDDPIVVRADPEAKQLRAIGISWGATCADGQGYYGFSQLTPTKAVPGFSPAPDELIVSRNAKGRFAGTQLAGEDLGEHVAAISVEVSGTLKPTRASGNLNAVVKVVSKATGAAVASCEARLRWDARREPEIVYGGATSQGEPIVIRLNARRKRVNDVRLTWRASCSTPGNFYRGPDHFVGFALNRAGRFGNPFSSENALDGGGKRRWDYRITGRVTRQKASGTMQAKVADTDAAGAATDVCETGKLSWKATTG